MWVKIDVQLLYREESIEEPMYFPVSLCQCVRDIWKGLYRTHTINISHFQKFQTGAEPFVGSVYHDFHGTSLSCRISILNQQLGRDSNNI